MLCVQVHYKMYRNYFVICTLCKVALSVYHIILISSLHMHFKQTKMILPLDILIPLKGRDVINYTLSLMLDEQYKSSYYLYECIIIKCTVIIL